MEEAVGEETVSQDIEQLDDIRSIVLDNVKNAQDKTGLRMKAQINKTTFVVGDKVWRQNIRSQQRKGGKLASNFLGPFTITALEGKSADLLGDNGAVLKKVSTDHLRPFKKQTQGFLTKYQL